jgi:uncharacterized protein (TIGR02284 family)
MKTDNEKTIKILNDLLEVNNDRIEGYKHASDETRETDLKDLFSRLSETSSKFKSELIPEIQKLGGTPVDGTATTGKLYRVWMDVRAALTNRSRKAILRSCEMGEDVAVRNYEEALKDVPSGSPIYQLINNQYKQIKSEHDWVRTLRNEEINITA